MGLNAPRHGLWMALDAVVVHGALPRAAAASATVARSVPSATHVWAMSRSPSVPPWHRGFVHKARAYLGASGRCLPLSPAPSCPGYPRSSPSAPAGAVAGDLCSTQCATVQLGDASGTLMLGKLVRPPQRWRCMALRRRRLVRSGTVACAYCPTVIIAAAMVAAVRQPLAPLQYKMSRPSTLRGIGGPRARGGRQSGGLPGNEWMDDVAAAPPLVRSETCHVIVQLVRRIMKERTCCSAVLGPRGGTPGALRCAASLQRSPLACSSRARCARCLCASLRRSGRSTQRMMTNERTSGPKA